MVLWHSSTSFCVAYVFIYLRYVPKSGISHWYNFLNILRNRSGSSIFQCHQKCMIIPIFSWSCQHFLSSDFLVLAISVGVISHCTFNLCISLMTDDVDHLLWAYWPCVYILYRNVYLNCCPFCSWVVFIVEL